MPTEQTCPNCGQQLDPGAAFCGNCGQAISLPASAASPIARVLENQAGPQLVSYHPITVQPLPAAAGNTAGLPSYAVAVNPSHHHVKLALAVVAGLLGIGAALFIPILAIALGITGIVLATTVPSIAGRLVKLAGITLAALAILAGLAAWVYIAVHDPRLKAVLATTQAQPAGNSRSAVTVTTPCYSVTFAGQLNVENQKGSCELNAYNGNSLESSTNLYKVLTSSAPTLTSVAFPGLAKSAIEKDVSENLPGFMITGENLGQFAGSPAYVVTTANKSNVAVVEAAILHPSTGGNNFFVLVHASQGGSANLSSMEQGWQWKQ
jgi:uncharacterized membrane protein